MVRAKKILRGGGGPPHAVGGAILFSNLSIIYLRGGGGGGLLLVELTLGRGGGASIEDTNFCPSFDDNEESPRVEDFN
jgi:hypothetical protein